MTLRRRTSGLGGVGRDWVSPSFWWGFGGLAPGVEEARHAHRFQNPLLCAGVYPKLGRPRPGRLARRQKPCWAQSRQRIGAGPWAVASSSQQNGSVNNFFGRPDFSGQSLPAGWGVRPPQGIENRVGPLPLCLGRTHRCWCHPVGGEDSCRKGGESGKAVWPLQVSLGPATGSPLQGWPLKIDFCCHWCWCWKGLLPGDFTAEEANLKPTDEAKEIPAFAGQGWGRAPAKIESRI